MKLKGRRGAGRPKDSGKYQESTKAVRIPCSFLLAPIQELLTHKNASGQFQKGEFHSVGVPFYGARIVAGSPDLSDDFIDDYLNFNQYLIRNPKTTFCVRVKGDSMEGAGIEEGDLLVVDQALEAVHGKIVVVALNGELTVKRLSLVASQLQLLPENPRYLPIDLSPVSDFKILGVAIHVIRSL